MKKNKTENTVPQEKNIKHFSLKDWKTWIPETLMGRSALIITIPLILLQIISTFIFYDDHWEKLSRRLAQRLAGDISHIRVHMRDHPSYEEFLWIQSVARSTMLLKISFKENATLPLENIISADGPFPDVLTRELWREMKRPFTIDFDYSDNEIAINMQLPNGVLYVLSPRKRLFSSTTYVFVIWMVGTSLLLFGLAVLFLDIQVRAVRRLARAADSFGKGRDVPNFKPEGALEVRQAGRAFTLMRNRIKRQIDQRTEMLAGVSHDLRTPLTRLKLQIEMLSVKNSDDIKNIKKEIEEMQGMLNGYLAFARGEGDEEPESTDISKLFKDIEYKFKKDNKILEIQIFETIEQIELKPFAFRRCITNLVDNAMRYGDHVILSAKKKEAYLEIEINDNGPGIPKEFRKNVFKAFFRVDPSRNPETGGVGLGLTIAQDIAKRLGGEITLGQSNLGGLKASLRLPL